MAEVGSFSEFLEAASGTEDIIITNDMDAYTEGYTSPLSVLNISCNIIGNGHVLKNIRVNRNSSTSLSFLDITQGGVTIEDVYFKNFVLSSENTSNYATTKLVSGRVSEGTKTQINNCKFSGLVLSNGRPYGGSTNMDFNDCAMDLTVRNLNYIGEYSYAYGFVVQTGCTANRCNIILRTPTFTTGRTADSIKTGTLNDCALIIYGAVVGSGRNVYLSGTHSYILFYDCSNEDTSGTTTFNMRGDGSRLLTSIYQGSLKYSYYNTITHVTGNNLKSLDYLYSIAWLP